MSKFHLKTSLQAINEIILVFLQFFIIILHFIQWDFLTKKEIAKVNPIYNFLGLLIIITASIVLVKAIRDLGSNLSPLPRPINNGNLITSGIYNLIRHPMYYSLIFISFGIFITKLSFYYLFLTISLALIIKFKITLEEKYLNIKFKNYILYKKNVKF